MYYAHSRNSQGQRQELTEHLRAVAELTASFAAAFGAAELGYFMGLWHDVGKFNPAFQDYLLGCEAGTRKRGSGPDHKAAGAQIALKHLAPLALLAQGHHGGLQTRTALKTWLQQLALKEPGAAEASISTARTLILDLEPSAALPQPEHIVKDPLSAELFLRMLFSALIDADRLDTEAHGQPEKAELRGSNVSMAELWQRFELYQRNNSAAGAPRVNTVRREVYESCLTAAELPPGLFRLAVPTGGGKTRSAMAFALRHALRYGHRRIIVAVPFISITEQTARTYRTIFDAADLAEAESVVLEHHSGGAVKPADLVAEESFLPTDVWQRLAAENWDAPIVVTTTVQLFESLFANNTTPCRKLHRLARSVIILDEAQALPAHLLRPILDAVQQLCRHYGATVVISTATQPAFDVIPDFAGLEAREIVPDPARHFATLKRVAYDFRTTAPLDWTEVGAIMRESRQALAILNTKRDALALLDTLADPEALHLSTLLCGAHRRWVIAEVKRRLEAGAPCQLVATQVVEAGVDIDFPLVLRALGPLDSVIQAAGRCNREGMLASGKVIVFIPAGGGFPPGAYHIGANITRTLLGRGDLDPDSPTAARRYFQMLFQTLDTDAKRIQAERRSFEYPKVAQLFKMIDEDTESVVVLYGSESEQRRVSVMLGRLRAGAPDARLILRRLQPYIVSLRTREANKNRDLIEAVSPGLGLWLGRYDRVRGLAVGGLDIEAMVV